MSEMTICNRCDYSHRVRDAKRRGDKIEVKPDPHHPNFPKGVVVLINGEPGPWYAELSEECAC
jgi:hypothetical protein